MKVLLSIILSLFSLCSFAQITTNSQWTWMKGDSVLPNLYGAYGSLGVSEISNTPGGRSNSNTWTDTGGNMWVFGGYGYAATGMSGNLSDLWKYNIATNQWTWIKGDSSQDQLAVYGSLGVAANSNKPGSRENAVSWTDASGNLWLFGGDGSDGTDYGYFSDLWKYSPSTNQWTWMKGDNTINQSGVYGTQGTPSATNKPGARAGSVTWVDASGNLWLFGGVWVDYTTFDFYLYNDLWKYTPASNQWTWVKGNNIPNQSGSYGAQGTPSASTNPGSRSVANTWIDASGNF